jgi:hypothetical protein
VHLKQQIISALDSKNPELKKIMLNVRKQVSRYEAAKKAGTLKIILFGGVNGGANELG